MSDGVHVDYKSIMDSMEIDFPAMYEIAIGRLLDDGFLRREQ